MTASAPAYSSQPSWTAALAELPGLELLWNEPLARHTTFRVGGPVTCLVRPRSVTALQSLLPWLRKHDIPHVLLGAGSNLLAADGGWDGVAIQLTLCCQELCREPLEDGAGTEEVRAGAGVKLARLLRFCVQQGLAGFEPLIGIPGTVGGSLVMNAGTRGGSISDTLCAVTLVDEAGTPRVLRKSELQIGYRCMQLPEGSCILEAAFHLQPEAPQALRARLRSILRQRRETQPLAFPSAGCVFKNPPGQAAGALIERAGLKGLCCGDAQISTKHANWIINLGRATAQDILTLVRIAEERVFQEFGIHLEREIRVLNL
jgi:UDP-N-acetylmuramate dehydrogenase